MTAPQKFDAANAQNLAEVSYSIRRFAVKAVEHAQTYWKLMEVIPPREMKFTQYDDEIFEHLMKDFPEYAEPPYEKLAKLDEDWMKTKDSKDRWRKFVQAYEKKIKDYNFGCLIRTNAHEEYTERNTIFIVRTQFYAIEIARNRLGLNDHIHEVAKAEKAKEDAEKAKAKASTKA
ncbi:DUF757-domain-containing protein [Fistulina hepatica ATCC 64428]|uniref:DUF757-domain-containing protein n=1 Tax=Fistulina hepatica ATCC 64428 TaxID=1128425 RepID=A0A0D7A8K5_9AGAR|nr:DUF757-domain-containing protein [Fistulina hepatica ATCC 64428]